MMGDDAVQLAPGAEENGLASMIADLVRQNLAQRPEKRKDFDALFGRVAIDARDIEVQVTLDFARGRLTVYDGVREAPMLVIRTDHDTILDLTLLGIRFGLPNYFDERGRAVLRKLFRGDLSIEGMWKAPVALTRLTRLLSVS
jgi:hypothetical protein